MKVICIDDSERDYGHISNNKEQPKYDWWVKQGSVYTVIKNVIPVDVKIWCYVLAEDPDGADGWSWEADRFVPLSDIDETELIKERELVEQS